jgi:ferredoxin-NADP reductase
MALEPWRIGKVIKIEEQTSATRLFFIQVPELERFDFKPGQFVTLDLPIHEKPNKRWRSYSISSWPNGTNVFELSIVLLADGAGTNYLFNEVEVGTEISLRGPAGVFVLPEKIEKDIFLICTGTGIAPFRSMVQHIIRENIPHQTIHLIFGCRKFGDALFANELKDLMYKDPDFNFHTAYSREEPGNYDHLVRIGYVHQVYEEICMENMTKDPENPGEKIVKPASFYLCGWKGMVDEAKKRITELGYDKKSIHSEIYG